MRIVVGKFSTLSSEISNLYTPSASGAYQLSPNFFALVPHTGTTVTLVSARISEIFLPLCDGFRWSGEKLHGDTLMLLDCSQSRTTLSTWVLILVFCFTLMAVLPMMILLKLVVGGGYFFI